MQVACQWHIAPVMLDSNSGMSWAADSSSATMALVPNAAGARGLLLGFDVL